jgi:hypothetical protein
VKRSAGVREIADDAAAVIGSGGMEPALGGSKVTKVGDVGVV